MKKLIKLLGVFAVIGTAAGLILAYFLKKDNDSTCDDDVDFTEDEDFDLDADLQPSGDREYVSLRKDSEEVSDENTESENTEE